MPQTATEPGSEMISSLLMPYRLREAVWMNDRFAPGEIRQATCNGKIERGTAVIERPWIRFSE
jgi:hypothetical protein